MSDAAGEVARFRLLLGGFAGTDRKSKQRGNRSKWTVTCILEAVVEVSQVRVQSDLLLHVPMVRFARLGWRQGEK